MNNETQAVHDKIVESAQAIKLYRIRNYKDFRSELIKLIEELLKLDASIDKKKINIDVLMSELF